MRGEGEVLPGAADSGIGEGGSGGAAEKSAVGSEERRVGKEC